MIKNKLKRVLAVALAGMMVAGVVGCSSSKDAKKNNTAKSEQGTEATTESKANTTADYVASNVTLPDNFDNMIYPIEALMVQKLSKGYAYYTNDTSEEEADSFWFSMAVLTSLMETESAYGDGVEEDSFYYLKENTTNMYASALYNTYGKGDMEFPEISDGDKYATYDDDKDMYGFLKGDVGSLVPYITDCTKDGSDYIITAELRNKDTDEVRGTYQVTITETSFDGDDNNFAYSVTDITTKENSSYGFDEENTTDKSEEEESTEESTSEEGSTTEADSKTDTDSDSSSSSSESISQDDALSQAKDYYGSDAEYSYKKKVTVGDKEYYDFSVKGDDISSTDVLVSVDGQDVIGGTQNDDGSWSFDQQGSLFKRRKEKNPIIAAAIIFAAAIIGFFSFLFLNKSGGEVGERVERLSWIEVREAFVFVLSYTFFEVVEDAVEQGGDEAEEYDGEHNLIHFEEKWRGTGGKMIVQTHE